MDIVGGPVKLVFGKYNYRPLNESEGNKLYDSMIRNGIQRYKVEHAIPIVVPEGFINPSSLTTSPNLGERLPVIEWEPLALEHGSVIAAGGRHRHYALQRYHKGVTASAEELRKKDCRMRKNEQDYRSLKQSLQGIEQRAQVAGCWIVAVYQEGEWSGFINLLPLNIFLC